MDFGLKGRVAIVAAASKGLGRAVAEEMAREGAEVALCARSEANLEQAAQIIRRATGREVPQHSTRCSPQPACGSCAAASGCPA